MKNLICNFLLCKFDLQFAVDLQFDLQFDWLRAVVFQLNLKYLQVKITNLLWVVVYINNSLICM